MSDSFNVALLQLNSAGTLDENLPPTIISLIREAASRGADMVMTPEMTDFYEPDLTMIKEKSYPETSHPLLKHASEFSRELRIWLLLGSRNVRLGDAGGQ